MVAVAIEAVARLSDLLRENGIDVHRDGPAITEKLDWAIWMTSQLRAADYVLVVASPEYRQASEDEAEPDKRRGAQWEARFIREEHYTDYERARRKYLAVVLPSGSVDDIPSFMAPRSAAHLKVDGRTFEGVESLYRILTGQPRQVDDPVGPVRRLPVRRPVTSRRNLPTELALEVSVTDGEVHCQARLGDELIGDRTSPVPWELRDAWRGLSGPVDQAEARLIEVGQQLRLLLFDDATAARVVEAADRAGFGATLDVEIAATGDAVGWPFELLRLADGRCLATTPGVRLQRLVAPAAGRAPLTGLPGPLKILAAVAAPEETRTKNTPLDVEREKQAVVDAVGAVASDPTNAQTQRDLSVSHERIGNVAVAAGDTPTALRAYRKALAIADKLPPHERRVAEALREKIAKVLEAQPEPG